VAHKAETAKQFLLQVYLLLMAVVVQVVAHLRQLLVVQAVVVQVVKTVVLLQPLEL
jgi:hypothetical protein